MTDVLTSTTQGRLRSFIQRLERLEGERVALAEDTKGVFGELKGEGFDPKIVRKVLRRRRTDKVKLDEEQALLDLYETAIQGDLFGSAADGR